MLCLTAAKLRRILNSSHHPEWWEACPERTRQGAASENHGISYCISHICHMSTIGCPYPSLKSLQNQASTSRVSSKVSKFWKRSRNWRWKKVKVKKRHTWQVILSSSTWWLIWFWWNLMKNSVHISSLNCTVHWPNELASPRFNAGPKIGTQRVQGIIPPVISSVAC